MRTLAVRWLKFNFVGALGILVQLGALALLVSGFHVAYLPATAIAVEAAVLHNFIWHEHFTWKDRTAGGSVFVRLIKFHLGNGLISIAGNLALMAVFVGALHMKYLIANVITIALCSLLNFAASEWFVFRTS